MAQGISLTRRVKNEVSKKRPCVRTIMKQNVFEGELVTALNVAKMGERVVKT